MGGEFGREGIHVYVWLCPFAVHLKNITTLFVNWLYPNTKYSKEIRPVNPKANQSWIFIGRADAEAEAPDTLATWCEALTYWKRHRCWGRWRAGGEGDDRGQDAWIASPTQWTWVWASFGRYWRTGKPGMLKFMGKQRVRHDLVTEQQLGGNSWSEKTAYSMTPTIWKRQNYGDSKKISGYHMLMERDGRTGRSCRIFRAVKLLCMTL